MANDEDDDAGCIEDALAAEEDCDEYIASLYASISPSKKGNGFYIPHLSSFHANTEVRANSRFFTHPRPYDLNPDDVPTAHPLRALARMLEDAPPKSVVRAYAYFLTDPYAIDLITHHAKSKTVRVIMHPVQKSIDAIKTFCNNFTQLDDYGNNAKSVFQQFVKIRVANLVGQHCTPFTSMHIKGIITDDLVSVGSYNLSVPARCTNSECMYFLQCTEQDKTHFDSLWDALEDRPLDPWNYAPALLATVPKRAVVSGTAAKRPRM